MPALVAIDRTDVQLPGRRNVASLVSVDLHLEDGCVSREVLVGGIVFDTQPAVRSRHEANQLDFCGCCRGWTLQWWANVVLPA